MRKGERKTIVLDENTQISSVENKILVCVDIGRNGIESEN